MLLAMEMWTLIPLCAKWRKWSANRRQIFREWNEGFRRIGEPAHLTATSSESSQHLSNFQCGAGARERP
jgi:hypothetical protein